MGMQLGIGSYTFPWAIGVSRYPRSKDPLNPMGLLQKARALAVGAVQICDNVPLHRMTKSELNELSTSARDMEISIEVGTSGIRPDRLMRYLDIAGFLSAKILRTTIHSVGSRPDVKQAMTWIGEVLPSFADAGVSIALENHERYTSRELADLVRRMSSPYLGICLDTVNSLGALEGPEQVVAELAPFTISLHVKDFDIMRVDHQMGFKIVGRPVGEGRLDVKWLFKTLSKEGKDPNAILELWTPFSETVEKTIRKEDKWAKESISYLRSMIR